MTKHITITLTEDQVNYLWLVLAEEARELQDTKVTEENKAGIQKLYAFNHRITAKLAQAKTS